MAKQSVTEEQKEKRKIWKRHIEQWSKSGNTQTEYCRRHRLSTKSFTYWKRRLSHQAVSLVPVQVKPAEPIMADRSSELVLHKDGYRIEIKEGFNPAVLREVLQTIRNVQC